MSEENKRNAIKGAMGIYSFLYVCFMLCFIVMGYLCVNVFPGWDGGFFDIIGATFAGVGILRIVFGYLTVYASGIFE